EDPAEAEARLRSLLVVERTVPALLSLVDILTFKRRFTETEPLLEEALALDPENGTARLRRAAYLARLGLYPQASEEMTLARRNLGPADFDAILRWQDLDRWLRDAAKSSFVMRTGLPSLPRWLKRGKADEISPKAMEA